MKVGIILVIEQEKDVRELISATLQEKGHVVASFSTCGEAAKFLQENPDIDVVLLDISLAGEKGNNFLQWIRIKYPDLPIIIVTTTMELPETLKCMREGAFDYLSKSSFYPEELHIIVKKAKELKSLKEQNRKLIQELESKSIESATKLKEIFLGSLNALVKTMEIRDGYLVGHSRRVASISLKISRKIGFADNLRKKIL
ncbi:MAG: response regulator, partial [Caldiserica bacterium]|nr:response regulator [Caldisericota bacterium]